MAINITTTKAPLVTPLACLPLKQIFYPRHTTPAHKQNVLAPTPMLSPTSTPNKYSFFPSPIDHLGCIVHHFHQFLYPPDSLLPDPEPPPFRDPSDFPHYPAYIVHTNAGKCPAQQILKLANRNWYQEHGHATRFGTS
jgi:hypothetical protein